MTKPTKEGLNAAFDSYVRGVGSVAFTWNRLLETLGQVFVEVTGMNYEIAKAIWYSIDNDRSQISMLRAAIEATSITHWLPRFPDARDDLEWLGERSFNLADARNNAVHAPCIVQIEESGAVAVSDPFSGHRRAGKLSGIPLKDEFAFISDRASHLALYADMLIIGLRYEHTTWPRRPVLPEKTHQKVPIK
jgi:hypothetical protein